MKLTPLGALIIAMASGVVFSIAIIIHIDLRIKKEREITNELILRRK